MVNQIKNRHNNNDKSFDNNGVQNGLIKVPKSCKCHGANGLHRFNCMPEHLQLNKYIHTGYRVDLSTWECLKSLFYLHNESFNVYSHGMYYKLMCACKVTHGVFTCDLGQILPLEGMPIFNYQALLTTDLFCNKCGSYTIRLSVVNRQLLLAV